MYSYLQKKYIWLFLVATLYNYVYTGPLHHCTIGKTYAATEILLNRIHKCNYF